MHESLPPRRRIFTTAHDEEEEYDVYDFFPSQNRFYMRLRLSSEADESDTFIHSSSDHVDSIDSLPALDHLRKLPSPPDVQAPELAFPERVDVSGIQRQGYSRIFRTGLWAQSRITRRLDAFIAKTMARLRSLKRCLTRRTS
ncbi:hypothetical protein OH76DRAFT_1480264 [Lentinus brumalis]|uniref:Uncharacterized protein n=1 Tax=Lentinus brumalis TaxID=2498619 RepID=A0A371DL57_9APHY|nr:hypothetical protein OH76DRAFT_1480264 [Polyporus brumalis]